MTKINLPSEILQKEALKSFPAKEKEEYLSNVLKKILELNPDGVIISQIREATGLTYSTIWHHLEVLSNTAQGRKISRGNTDIYYPIGKLNHLNDYDKGKVRYAISTVENDQGKFVCIHEAKENRSGNYAVCKGVAIPVEIIDNLLNEFGKIKKKLI